MVFVAIAHNSITFDIAYILFKKKKIKDQCLLPTTATESAVLPKSTTTTELRAT